MLNHTVQEVGRINKIVKEILGNSFEVSPYYDGSLQLLYEGVNVTSEEVFNKLRESVPYDIEVFINGIITIYTERVVELISVTSNPGHYTISNEDDLLRLKRLLSLEDSTLEFISNVYHKLTGKEVIDRRDDSEYTNVDAQDDPDFWSEELINDKVNYKCL